MLSAGTRVGPYEIVSWLGAGGIGEVYRAHDTKLQREVALKTLPAELAREPQRLTRLRNEGPGHDLGGSTFGLARAVRAVALDSKLDTVDSMLSAKYDSSMNARQIAKVLGRRGGRMRAMRLSAEERRRIAALGGKARSASLLATRRIVANLRYAALVEILRGRRSAVTRVQAFAGPLPGIYASRR